MHLYARLAVVALATASLALPMSGALAAPTPHPGTVSLGVAFGEPTAVDLKLWTGQGSGFNFGVGIHRFSDRLGAYAEYELGLIDFWIGNSVMSVFYIGVGGAVAMSHKDDKTSLALVIPIGLNFRFKAPVEVFIEARPGIALLSGAYYGGFGNSAFGLGGQLGVRYVF